MEAKKGYTAKVGHLMISPHKLRRIANEIRKKPYIEAIAVLDALPHKGARLIRKVVQSAASNAMFQNKKLDEEMLYIKELQINEGPRFKRLWPRSHGRGDILLKRMSHISVIVDEIAGLGE